MNQLLAAVPGWVLDVVFFVILIGGMLIGLRRGLVKGICKIAGTVFSVIVSTLFCIAFQNKLEAWFGLTTALTNVLITKIPEEVATVLAYWIANGISFVVLVVLVKFGTWLIGKVGTALVEKSKILGKINSILGGLLGLFEGALLIFFLLAICTWINVGFIDAYIRSSFVVGRIYEWVWFQEAVRLTSVIGG